ncbi:MAG: hypothetical protein ACD_45C00499G0002 [uncultured bacterium]|nr:MAG: hypothetical protein ACD_45C00499G0002 [uncultured bacterium]
MMTALMRRWLPLTILLIGLGTFFYFDLSQFLHFTALKQHRQTLLSWTGTHYFLTVLTYIVIYILAVAVSVPGATFLTLVGGFLFGIVFGTLYVLISATLGATLIFLAVRIALEPWMAKKTTRWIEKMRSGFQQGAFQYLLFLRLAPLFPFWVINIVPALLGVKTRTFMLATFIGIIPGSVVYVTLGNGLGSIFDQNETPNLGIIFELPVLLPLLGLAFLSLVPIIYKWMKRKSHHEIDQV